MLRTFVNCTMVLTKHLNFPIAKGGTEAIVHLSITEGLSFRSLERRFTTVNRGMKIFFI